MILLERCSGIKADSPIFAWKTWCKVAPFTEIRTQERGMSM